MKKLILTFGVLYASISSQAQLSQGRFAVGGSLGISTQSSKSEQTAGGTTTTAEGPRTTSFALLPRVQYFVMDNISVGATLGYSSFSQTQTNNVAGVEIETRNRVTGLVAAPFGRYHYMFAENFGLFGQAEIPLFLGASSEKVKSGSTTNELKGAQTSIGFNLSPGFVFFPTKNFGLEARLGNLIGFQRTVNSRDNSGIERKDYNTQFSFLQFNSLSFNLGLAYYF